ncbi:protein kinase family protein [Nonomuraea insulae]|uniref:Protein kinase family protein n=1 Tax=Nonomuraea insulae TaxID=1616787 RepID=A0ABW1CLQ8_9ACTN
MRSGQGGELKPVSQHSRLAAYGDVSTSLALRGDHELAALLESAVPLGTGIGGTSVLLEVEGRPVFVKRVALTDLEREPANVRSTANVYDLPAFCQYGIGSPGFGAWRELAAHTMTTNWVLTGQFAGFPLMYHWRVLPHSAPAPVEELADVDRAVAYWGGGAGVRRRIEALRTSSASLTLFMEHLPHNLHEWLTTQVNGGIEAACSVVERGLRKGVSFMNSRGLLHFDAHFENIMTDGERLYFADFGLATSTRFALSPEERDFLDVHRTYDQAYTISYLVNWLAAALYERDRDERAALVRSWAGGKRPIGTPGGIAEILSRHSPLATVMNGFYRGLQSESRKTPYPLEEIRRVLG